MTRLTNDKTAQDLKDICEGFETVGQAPAMTHLRYVKLAEYEQTGYDPEEIRDILKSVDAEKEPPKKVETVGGEPNEENSYYYKLGQALGEFNNSLIKFMEDVKKGFRDTQNNEPPKEVKDNEQ